MNKKIKILFYFILFYTICEFVLEFCYRFYAKLKKLSSLSYAQSFYCLKSGHKTVVRRGAVVQIPPLILLH